MDKMETVKAAFSGFPREAMEFFRDLEANNTREWFQPRKEQFERFVKAPMEELVGAVNAGLARFAPDHVTDAKKAIFRIYRDTRFSADKTPYKDRVSASFGRRGMEKVGAGGFYFAVNHKEVEVAGGVYHPESEAMLTIRTHIAESYDEFRRILANRKLRKTVGELQGSELTRVPKGFTADHPAADLLKKKDWIFYVVLDPGLATSSRLLPEILSRFETLAPAIEYLNAPLRSKRAKTKIYRPSDHF
jgi:uncharacterized protein (TIGR02453 family)